jgi:DNA-binding CsgD family transcriptional regulator
VDSRKESLWSKLALTKAEDEILSRLSIITRIVALDLVRGISSREEQVELLNVAGLTPREISDLLGIKYGTVAQILFKIRQTNTKRRAKLARESRQ